MTCRNSWGCLARVEASGQAPSAPDSRRWFARDVVLLAGFTIVNVVIRASWRALVH
jgi:hypothetical protein